jgi:hypothetical protein
MKRPIPFSSFGGYRRLCLWWWNDLLSYITGITFTAYLHHYDKPRPSWRSPGWWNDIRTYWLRARYGWAPRDTWGLNHHLNGVLAGSLWYLAEHKNGTPVGYGSPTDDDPDTNHEQWEADLKRWALAFSEDPDDVEIYDEPHYAEHSAEEHRRRAAIHQALREMEPWWDALWD